MSGISLGSIFSAGRQLKVLSRHAGIGLWDAVLYRGDPMHRRSRWEWSAEFRRLLGFDSDDTRGFPNRVESWSDRLHPDDADRTFETFNRCLNDRSGRTGYDVYYRLQMKDGRYRWFHAIGGVQRNGSGLAMRACGSLLDVDEAYKELERGRLLGENAGVGLWDAQLYRGDPAHAESHWTWSGEFRRLLGFARDDMKGFPDIMSSWSDRLHAEDVKRTFDTFGHFLDDRTGSVGYDIEYRLRMKDGDYRWFRAIGGVSRDGKGNPLRACGSLIDIQEKKEKELLEAGRRQLIDMGESLSVELGAGAEQAARSAESIASATQELSASVAEISRRISESTEFAERAASHAAKTNSTVSRLTEASEQIGRVAELISSIATRTNMLALNATIEAARAGEAGRGFGVVANEVKSLADQTSKATGGIVSQIQSLRTGAREAGEAMQDISGLVLELQNVFQSIDAAVTQQSSSTQEIAASITHVVHDTRTVNEDVQKFVKHLHS